jgi:hypothetical protein
MHKFLKMLATVALVSTLSACGGGDTAFFVTPPSQNTNSNAYVLPKGRSAIAFSAFSTARLAAPISGVELSITLPEGMSVPTSGGTNSGPIETTALVAGTALTGTNLAFGSYSASTRKVRLSMTTTSSSYRQGEFLRLFCDVTGAAPVTLGDLRALNSPVVIKKAVGYDAASQSTVLLTNKLMVTVDAVKQ